MSDKTKTTRAPQVPHVTVYLYVDVSAAWEDSPLCTVTYPKGVEYPGKDTATALCNALGCGFATVKKGRETLDKIAI